MEKIYNNLKKVKAYTHAINLMSWDMETELPPNGVNNLTQSISVLSEEKYKLITNEEFVRTVKTINEKELSPIDKRVIYIIKNKELEILKIPMELYSNYEKNRRITVNSWQKGKQNNDYSDYKNKLVHLIKLNKKILESLGYINNLYDKLLDEYEEGLNQEIADKLFEKIKNELIPFLKKVLNKDRTKLENAKKKFFSRKYDINTQKMISKRISEELGFNYNKGVLKESEHPFTISMCSRNDVRFTTHYYENNPISGVYSTLHETGHGVYEQNISDKLKYTFLLNNGASTGIHEAISRFYENLIGKNEEYIKYLYQLFVEYFQIDKDNIDYDEFYLIVNEVNSTLIRTEADELTYPLHILIRYEIEKDIFKEIDKTQSGDELLKKWNEKYKKYLGIVSETVSDSIMQDIHWAEGLFGYFPSYLIGSAYASQIYYKMDEKINIDECIKNREFYKIKDYLTEYVFKYGASKTPMELIKISTNEKFNANYYIKYLIDKYSKVYEIE